MKNLELYHLNEKTANVTIKDTEVLVERLSLHPVKQIFPKERLTHYEFGNILRLRCWDEHRANLDKYLEKLGLKTFDVYKICEKTHGTRKGDYIWFKFEGEDIKAGDVLCLN